MEDMKVPFLSPGPLAVGSQSPCCENTQAAREQPAPGEPLEVDLSLQMSVGSSTPASRETESEPPNEATPKFLALRSCIKY